MQDQSRCPDGTGPNGGTTACGSGASGIDNLWHDQTSAGDELASGSNPMWHAKNLERGALTSYLPRFGLDPKDTEHRTDGYTRHWNDTPKASWLWHEGKKVFLSTQDTQDTAAKADYIKNKGACGAMIWEPAGDYECPDDKSGQCVPGYTLTKQLDDAPHDAGPYGATRAGKTKLPSQVLDACQEIPPGRSMDIPIKYYLPTTGPANVTVNSAAAKEAGDPAGHVEGDRQFRCRAVRVGASSVVVGHEIGDGPADRLQPPRKQCAASPPATTRPPSPTKRPSPSQPC
ncbi:chitinase C-terminal domain-containing protein [Streptomyces sp. NPDC059477]|uniref:chitinase C-terminal domain-containing protein n=1 Tax=Streptomyces sp. NPDC059477 TaxID=3346847 RepID=UPI00369798E5